MIQSVDMNETAGMLEARLRLIDRIRRVEHTLARDEQAKIAAALMKGRSHDLGNHIQIVKLTAHELERRAQDRADFLELITDMRQSAEQATTLLAEMVAAARPADRTEVGPVVTNVVRAAVEQGRAAVPGSVELRIDLDDTVHTYANAEELEAIVLAAILDASSSSRMTIVLRERLIQGRRWVELLRVDDRQQFNDGELAHMFEPHSLLHVVAGAAKFAGGEASLSPGRGGLELAIELPVVARPLG
jgi:nitrogen-specific signal transduction histidine kinase